jgi:DnaJ-class molecular chaperone
MRKKKNFSEKEICDKFVGYLTSTKNNIVTSEIRIPPAEFDIVSMDINNFLLTNYEIKKDGWKKLLNQSVRGQLYCHYAVAVLPKTKIKKGILEEFSMRGVGLIGYSLEEGDIKFETVALAEQSTVINEYFKKTIYHILDRVERVEYAAFGR